MVPLQHIVLCVNHGKPTLNARFTGYYQRTPARPSENRAFVPNDRLTVAAIQHAPCQTPFFFEKRQENSELQQIAAFCD
jgi:hypothetical protein